jgi:hypothetical protein
MEIYPMSSSGHNPADSPSVSGLGWTAADTGYIINCHVCANRDIELIHVHYNRPEAVQHECPLCGCKIGPSGPIAECAICRLEFGITK